MLRLLSGPSAGRAAACRSAMTGVVWEKGWASLAQAPSVMDAVMLSASRRSGLSVRARSRRLL